MALRPTRWQSMMERRPSVSAAAGLFVFYVVGAVLMIGSMWAGFYFLLLAAGSVGAGVGARLGGLAGLALSAIAFLIGRWLLDQHRVQRRTKRRDRNH